MNTVLHKQAQLTENYQHEGLPSKNLGPHLGSDLAAPRAFLSGGGGVGWGVQALHSFAAKKAGEREGKQNDRGGALRCINTGKSPPQSFEC